MCSGFGETLVQQEELSESQRKPVLAMVNHLCSDGAAEDLCDTPAHFSAAHLLVSAMEGEVEGQKLHSEQNKKRLFHTLLIMCVQMFSCRVAWWNSELLEREPSWLSGDLRRAGSFTRSTAHSHTGAWVVNIIIITYLFDSISAQTVNFQKKKLQFK